MYSRQTRMYMERDELAERLGKLRAFRDTPMFGELRETEQNLLNAQETAMSDYLRVLERRIDEL